MKRNRPGTKRKEIDEFKLMSETEAGSSLLSVQQYIQEQFKKQQRNGLMEDFSKEKVSTLPSIIKKMIKCPDGIEESVWIYENTRQFVLELQSSWLLEHAQMYDNISKEKYPEMTIIRSCQDGDEEDLQFFCALFNPPKMVPAADYLVHTLNQAQSMLNDLKLCPNRLTITEKGMRELNNQIRRLYRYFAYSYFMMFDAFQSYERKTLLCLRFLKFVRKFKLLRSKNLFFSEKDVLKAIEVT